jgi:hypothetical protein
MKQHPIKIDQLTTTTLPDGRNQSRWLLKIQRLIGN